MLPDVLQVAQNRELISRVLASRQFRRTARLRDFLSYLCEHGGNDLHEQEIGMQVFGRSEGYDTALDNIVRVNAFDLRKRLTEHFATEGRDEPVIIEIPKGSYRPVFTPRPQPEPVIVAPIPPPAPSRTNRRALWAFAAVALLLAVACGWLIADNLRLRRIASGSAAQPNLSLLWSRMLPPGQSAEVVIADSCLSIFQDLVRKPIGLQDYLSHSYLVMPSAAEKNPEYHRALETIMTRRYTSMADVDILRRLFSMSGANSNRLNVHFSRDFPAESMRSANVILVGSKRSDPWVELYDNQLNFHFEFDDTTVAASVINREPRNGEKSRYMFPNQSPNETEAFGEVAFLPNANHTGNVLIIQGTGMQGTDAAGELATSEEAFAQVVKLLRPSGSGLLPHFEVLLKNRILGGTVQDFEIVALRQR